MAIVERKNRDGSITYQVKVKDNHGAWYPTAGFRNDLESAKREELRLMELKRKGKNAICPDAKRVTFDEYWEVWKIENRTNTSEGWKITQDQMYKDYIRPVLGDLKLIEIDSPVIGRVLNRVKNMGRSEQTRKHVYSLINLMFNDAVEYYEMLAASPVKAKFHRPKPKQAKRPFLEPSQAWTLLEFVEDHYLGPAIWIQLLSGMRVEAAIALSWDCVEWDRDQFLIRRAWKQKLKRFEDYPKGKDWEYVPMIPQLKAYLYQRWLKVKDPTDFVCLSNKGKRLTYNTYHKAIKTLCRKAGVPPMTTHELRHSCTEIWVKAGASQEDIRRLLNHKSLSATKNYLHRTDERLTSIGQQIGKPVLKLVSQSLLEASNA